MTKRIQPPSRARSRPLCYVLLPSGLHPDAAGCVVDFDGIYHSVFEPALEHAGMRAIRADPDGLDVASSKPPYEEMLLSDPAARFEMERRGACGPAIAGTPAGKGPHV